MRTEAEEAKARSLQNGAADIERGLNQQWSDRVDQYVTDKDLAAGQAEGVGGVDVEPGRDGEGLRTGNAGELRGQSDCDGDHRVFEAWPEGGRESDGKHQRREGEHGINNPHDDHVENAASEARSPRT